MAAQRNEDLLALRRHPLVRLVERIDRVGRAATDRLEPVRRLAHGVVGRVDLAARSLVGGSSPALPRSVAHPTDGTAPATGALTDVRVAVARHGVGDQPDPRNSPPITEMHHIGEEAAECVRRLLAETVADMVWLVHAAVDTRADALPALLAAHDRGVGAVTALTVLADRPWHRATPGDGLVREAGLSVELAKDGCPLLRFRGAGTRPVVDGGQVDEVSAATAACVLLDVAAVRRVGGLRAGRSLDLAVADLCLRLRADGLTVRCLARPIGTDHRLVPNRAALLGPVGDDDREWQEMVARHGAALLNDPSTGRHGDGAKAMRIAFTIGAPLAKVATRWGDWHLAVALADELRRLGHEVLVQTADAAGGAAGRVCDVHVVVRGLVPVRPTPGQRQVLWIISHPETVTGAECDAADLVLVASERFAGELRARTTTPVEVLLQATDHHRFRPVPPLARHRHEVTVVAKSRDVLRPMVADALAAGIRPAIYGSGWRGLVDPDLIVAEHVDNAELPAVYSSAGVVLNDHWDTMRRWGFVSNRVFDVVACGTPLVSDDLPEIVTLFGTSISTWGDGGDLAMAVEAVLGDPEAARERAAAARREVLTHHTFEVRARELIQHLLDHQIIPER